MSTTVVASMARLAYLVWDQASLDAVLGWLAGGPEPSEAAKWDVLRAGMLVVEQAREAKFFSSIDVRGRSWSFDEARALRDGVNKILES